MLTLYLISALFALSGYFSLVQKSLPLAGLTLILSVGAVVGIKLLLGERSEPRQEESMQPGSTGESMPH